MRDKRLYEYAIVRYLPQVEREEFVNIGVILYAASHRFLAVKWIENFEKVKCFSKKCNTKQLKVYMDSWDAIASGHEKGGVIGSYDRAYRFRWLTAHRSTIIQSSAVHPGRCDDPAQTLARLFDFYVD